MKKSDTHPPRFVPKRPEDRSARSRLSPPFAMTPKRRRRPIAPRLAASWVVVAVLLAGAPGSAVAAEDPTFGSWSAGAKAPGNLLATHSILLRNGKILVVGGSSYNCCFSWGMEEARLYDIASDSWSAPLPSPAPYGSDRDAFCSGHSHDDAGGVIFQGGLHSYVHNGHGITDSARYDPASATFTQISGGVAHWYPTLVAGVGHTFVFPGIETELDDTANGESIQRMAYGEESWTTTGVSHRTLGTYPRVSLLPNGKLFVASPAAADRRNYTFDPETNAIALAGTDVVPESETDQVHGTQESWRGTGVLLPLVPNRGTYPEMRFALIGGVQAYVKDLGQTDPVWQGMGERPPELGSPPPQRIFANSTLLPTGQVLVTGGVEPPLTDAAAVRQAEVYDPETDGWLLTSAATVPRNYHGVALLLPDGRVWTASGSQDHSGSQCGDPCNPSAPEKTEERVEIFTPWFYELDRPVLTSCPGNVVPDGRPFDIGIEPSGAGPISRVVLMRPGSVTHSFDTDQRLIQLDIVGSSATKVTVRSPYSAAAAPPGDYMLFALRANAPRGFKRWVPSVACWTRVATRRPEGASIWRYTGTPCDGDACPGWQRLDNNPKSVGIAAAGTHHYQTLYQLHNDGWIWRYTGTPCENDSCPGWQRLDNNSRTFAIAAAGPQLYQLHHGGSIWRFTGTPCAEDSCPGWQRLDNNYRTSAIAVASDRLYQLHTDGRIWRYTGTPCDGDSCHGWQLLDNNSKTVAIAAAGTQLYQRHADGEIWRHTGTPCDGDTCPGWQRLDNNYRTVAIVAAGSELYQLHDDGSIWRFTGTPCSGESCPGWQRLDNNSRTVALASTGTGLYQLHNDGRIWRYTGTPCDGDSCPGWQPLDNNPRTGAIVAGDPPMVGAGDHLYQLHTDPLYQMHHDGAIWRYTGTECDGEFCPGWQRLDNNPKSAQIVASGGQLFQRHDDGAVWRHTGAPCMGASCPGWERLDNNRATQAITVAGNQLYQLHRDGRIWRYTGEPCSGESCPGWEQLDNNPRAVAIAAGGNGLFQLHDNGDVWRHTGTPCTGSSCPGWIQLDNNPRTEVIMATANQLFQLHDDGRIWRYTGTPCTGASCPGWQLLDNNPQTAEISGGGIQLYQRHANGEIWRYTGVPCNGESCPGWERLDDNPQTRQIVVTGSHLYQRHADGRIWRYVGPPCGDDGCPGWRQLDNNAATELIATGGFD